MKKNIQLSLFTWLNVILFLSFGCKKQELATKNPPKVVSLEIKGSKGLKDTLEFVKNGKVIAQTLLNNNDFVLKTNVTIENGNAEIQVRLKGQQKILATRLISDASFIQTINCYYDGNKVYGNSVQLKIKGFAINDVLEFLLDGSVIAAGTGTEFPAALALGIETGEKRKLQIRKKGESTFLLTKDIIADQLVQTLTFFYDGTQFFDKINVGKPANPANMLLSVKFSSSLTQYTGPTDLIILYLNENWEKVPTDYRIAIPDNGSFSTAIEIAPLPEGSNSPYSYKLVKRGTMDELPYDLSNLTQPINPESASRDLTFNAGSSSMLVIDDILEETKTGPIFIRGTYIGVTNIDISEYFK